MKISKFFETHSLHDSVIHAIRFDAHRATCTFEVALCNYMQPGYREGWPEIVDGRLVFGGLRYFEGLPPEVLSECSEAVSGEVLASRLQSADKDGQAERWELELLVETYPQCVQDFFTIVIEAEDVVWLPDEAVGE